MFALKISAALDVLEELPGPAQAQTQKKATKRTFESWFG